MRYWSRILSLTALAMTLCFAVTAGVSGPHDSTPSDEADPQTAPPAVVPLREGTALRNELGRFRMIGNRATFFTADGKRRLVGLENLNLERIVGTISDSPNSLVWSITGTISEFRGANYILVSRAVLKTRHDAVSPQQPPKTASRP